MKFEKVVDGVVKYIDRTICPTLNPIQEIGYRVICAKIYKNLDGYKKALSENPIVKTFAIIDESGDVDVDDLLGSLKQVISSKGSLEIDIPLYGIIKFTESDVDDLSNFLTENNK